MASAAAGAAGGAAATTAPTAVYKFYYFDIYDRGETGRLMFLDAGVAFDDVRIQFKDWGTTIKTQMPFAALPVLEVAGVKHPESGAIHRYIAKKCKQYGSTDEEALSVDSVVEALGDVRAAFYKAAFAPPESSDAAKSNFYKQVIPTWITRFEQQWKQNGSKPFFVLATPTYADFEFFGLFRWILADSPTALDASPTLKALFDRIGARPAVAAYAKAHVAKFPTSA